MAKNLPAKSDKPEDQKIITRGYHFSGPIPPPSLLNKYDPQTRKVIVEMANRQSEHRQLIERKVIESNVQNEKTGMWISAFITVLMMVCGTIVLLSGKSVIGFLTIFAPAVFVASNYVYQKYQENKVKEEDKDGGE